MKVIVEITSSGNAFDLTLDFDRSSLEGSWNCLSGTLSNRDGYFEITGTPSKLQLWEPSVGDYPDREHSAILYDFDKWFDLRIGMTGKGLLNPGQTPCTWRIKDGVTANPGQYADTVRGAIKTAFEFKRNTRN